MAAPRRYAKDSPSHAAEYLVPNHVVAPLLTADIQVVITVHLHVELHRAVHQGEVELETFYVHFAEGCETSLTHRLE